MSIKSPRTRIVYLLIWAGASIAFQLYALIAHIGTGEWIILGALVLIFLALVGIVLSLHEEAGRAGKDIHSSDKDFESQSTGLVLWRNQI